MSAYDGRSTKGALAAAVLAAAAMAACGGLHGGTAAGQGGAGGAAGLDGGGSAGAGGGSAGAGGGSAVDGGVDVMPAVPVAAVAIQQADVRLAPGGTAPLAARALDAAGGPLTTAFAWRSSDASVATVDASGLVTAVALGSAQITAAAGGVTSAPVTVWVNPPGTTGTLLAAAVAAGEISADQALVYRVWATFGDPRLPGKYRGNVATTGIGHDLLMVEAANRFDALTPDLQAAIGLYFVPPAYVPTAAAPPPGTAPAASTARPGICSGWSLGSDWTNEETAHFHVWHTKKGTTWGTGPLATVTSAAETAYAALVTANGFRAPLDDSVGHLACYGGDGKIDIYLLDEPLDGVRAMTVPMDADGGGQATAVYILISSALATDPAETLSKTIAHEFMHGVQFGYVNLGLHSYDWTLDATATWAVQIVFPTSSAYQAYATSFLLRAEEPLFFPNHYCEAELAGDECREDSDSDLKMYGAYLFFEFLTHAAGPTTVRNFFENAQYNAESLGTLNYVLSGVGGLTTIWPQFTLALWNQDPVPKDASFRGWDGLPDTLEPATWNPQLIDLADNGPNTRTLTGPIVVTNTPGKTVGLRELSASFDHYTFGDGVHSLVFYNGFSQNLSTIPLSIGVPPDPTLPAGDVFVSFDQPPPDQAKGRALWALKRIDGVWTMEDWTNQHIVAFCRDKAAERIQDLVLLYSNGNFTTVRDANYDANALGPIGDKKATLVASPMPCWKYQGSATSHLLYSYANEPDSFDIKQTLAAAFVGAPHISAVTLAAGTGTVMVGWRFTADPATVSFMPQWSGTLRSCGLTTPFSDSAMLGASWFQTLPSFDSLFPIPGGDGEFAYSGSGIALQWTYDSCMGATKLLPALHSFDFTLDSTMFQKIDLPNRRLFAGPPGQTGPVADDGSYPNPPIVSNTWCFSALREGGAAPSGCP